MKTHLPKRDYWSELVERHKDDIVQFLNQGSFSDNSQFRGFFQYYYEDTYIKRRIEWQFNIQDKESFLDTDICNAIYELKHMAKDQYIRLEIVPAIAFLCKAYVDPANARDILMKTENGFRKILISYFQLIGKQTSKDKDSEQTSKDKDISFHECEETLAWLLSLYHFEYPPLEIVRKTRNKVHSVRINPRTQEPETDRVTGKILYDDKMLPDDEVLALEVVKFIVFSYVGVVAVVRKFIAKKALKESNPQYTEEIIKKIVEKYKRYDYKNKNKTTEKHKKKNLITEYLKKVPSWAKELEDNAEKILAQYDSRITVNLNIHSESEVTSVKWKIGSDQWNTGTEILTDRYKKIEIEEEEGDWGLIDRDGNLVIDCRYTEIIPVKDGLFNARKRYKWTILNKEGQEVR